MTARPWMKFYPSDWRADPRLRMCSLAARGLWMEMLCVMHESEPRGSLHVNGRPLDLKGIASLASIRPKECEKLLAELENSGVFSRETSGEIYSRRMRRDTEKALRDKENGSSGGNPALKAWVNPQDKAQKLEARSQILEPEESKQEPSLRSVALVEQKPKPESDWPATGFDQFWKIYPHKVGKQAALRAFAKAKRTETPWARVVSALDQYVREKPIDRAWCNPATWLNEGRYDDEPAKNGGGNNGFRGSRSFQDDSRSVTKAIDRRLEQAEQLSFPPRPSLMPQEREADRRLLPPGRSTEPGTVR